MTLPPLIIWSGNAAEWNSYIDQIYDAFLRTFIHQRQTFNSKPINAKRHPEHDGKSHSFWHIVSEEGSTGNEQDRLPKIARCARIEWIGYILTIGKDHPEIWYWQNQRQGRKNHLLYLHQEKYLVVLEERENYFLLKTAYNVEYEHSHKKLEKEKREWCDNQA